MISTGLKDAFFFVTIHTDHQKYFKFLFDNLCKFACTRYEPAMRIFTKISKVLFGHPRNLDHNSAVYKDDTYLLRDACQYYVNDVPDTIELFRNSGFIIPQISQY